LVRVRYLQRLETGTSEAVSYVSLVLRRTLFLASQYALLYARFEVVLPTDSSTARVAVAS
jgi:hypothetical protein